MGLIRFIFGLIGGFIGLVFGLFGAILGLFFGIGGAALGLVLTALVLLLIAPMAIVLPIIF
jgi:hypothetical protein